MRPNITAAAATLAQIRAAAQPLSLTLAARSSSPGDASLARTPAQYEALSRLQLDGEGVRRAFSSACARHLDLHAGCL